MLTVGAYGTIDSLLHGWEAKKEKKRVRVSESPSKTCSRDLRITRLHLLKPSLGTIGEHVISITQQELPCFFIS